MTFQEQCMKTVFPRFVEGINAANRRAKDLEAKVQELEETLAEIREHGGDLINDLLDRVNSLEAKAAEKKTRKPRAKKQADPVRMVEQAAQDAVQNRAVDMDIDKVVVPTPEQAMNEIPF